MPAAPECHANRSTPHYDALIDLRCSMHVYYMRVKLLGKLCPKWPASL